MRLSVWLLLAVSGFAPPSSQILRDRVDPVPTGAGSIAGRVTSVSASLAAGPDRCLVPAPLRTALLDEISGESAANHVQILAVNRDRQPNEYLDSYFETTYIRERLQEYGLADVRVDYVPSGDVWDGEEADLSILAPVHRRIASLTMVPAALARGSASGDVEAELIYVGPGRAQDFEGKEVTGKIVLGNTPVTQIFNAAVIQRGAAAVLGTGSAGVSANSAGYSIDQIGWQAVNVPQGRSGAAWVLSVRQFNELRDLLERGKVVVRSHVRARTYPNKLNVTSAAIRGSDPAAGELLFVAHAFETIATPGANDNCSGVGTTLEIARAMARAVKTGAIPVPKRTIRFLWVPEISGSRAFMYKNPELQDRLLAVLNFDMTGPDLEETDTYLRMKMTPDSRPSYLNDLIGNLLLFVDQTEIRTQTGNNAPFNYRLVPYIANSDHAIFLDAGIPAMQFNHWADNFYHSSADRAEYADPTEMKRVAFMGAAAFAYLANAGADEAQALAWEAAANGEKWISEVARQSARLLGDASQPADAAALAERRHEAHVKIAAAFQRAKGSVESVLTLSKAPAVTAHVQRLVAGLETARDAQLRKLDDLQRDRSGALNSTPPRTKRAAGTPVSTPPRTERAAGTPVSTPPRTERAAGTPVQKPAVRQTPAAEAEAAQLVPRRLYKFYSEDYRTRAEAMQRAGAPGGLIPTEITNFIDGQRSILEIYNLVRAEFGRVTTSSNDFKFAYVVTPDTDDVPIDRVVSYIRLLEKAGLVQIERTSRTIAR